MINMGSTQRTSKATSDNGTNAAEINNMWKMLDDMAANDPEAYEAYVAKHLGEDAINAKRKGKKRRKSFIPNPGIVVKTWVNDDMSGQRKKMFLNICSCEGVEPPISANGTQLGANDPYTHARQIPLLVSPVRDMVDKSGSDCLAVDVVYNPWVVTQISRFAEFRDQVVRLAMQWTLDETGIKLRVGHYKKINSVYKGGTGFNGNTPVPFPIPAPIGESRDSSNETKQSPGGADPSTQNEPATLKKHDFMSDPATMIKHLSSSKNAQDEQTSGLSLRVHTKKPKGDQGPSRKAIEVISSSERKPGGTTKSKGKGKSKSKSKGAVRKGFLNRASKKGKGKGLGLYGEAGSNEHEPQNPYPWANVVDTSYLNAEELKQTMEEHAKTGNVSKPTFTATSRKQAKKEDPMKSRNIAPTENEQKDFDDILAEADPEVFRTSVQEDAGISALETSSFMKMLSKQWEETKVDSSKKPTSKAQTNAKTFTQGNLTNKVQPPSSPTFEEIAADDTKCETTKPPSIVLKSPEYTLSVLDDGGGLAVKIDLPLIESMKCITLDISEKAIRLSFTKMYRSLEINAIPTDIDPSRCRAKFSKKRRELTIKIGAK